MAEKEEAAIKALGSLFKLTQVFLWDDALVISPSSTSQSFDSGGAFDSTFNGDFPSMEDMQLTEQMNAMGLPVSFVTSKRGSAMNKSKRKGNKVKHKSGYDVNKEGGGDVSKAKDGEVVSSTNFHDKTDISVCCVPTLARSETSCSDIAEEVDKPHCTSNGGSVNMEEVCKEITGAAVENCNVDHDTVPCGFVVNGKTEVVNGDGDTSPQTAKQKKVVDKKLNGDRSVGEFVPYYDLELYVDVAIEEPCVPDSGVSSQSSVMTDNILKDEFGNYEQSGDFGDWKVCWDTFYMRNYYYNIKTNESTWFPPPGVEHVAISECDTKPSDMIVDVAEMDLSSGEVLDPCNLEVNCHFLQEITSYSSPSGHSSQETSTGIEGHDGNAASSLGLPTVNCSYQHADELTTLAEFKKNSDGEVPLQFVSDTPDCINSHLESEEDGGYNLQNSFTNSKTNELGVCEHLGRLEKAFICEGVHKMCKIGANPVSDAGRLTTTITEVFEENWKEIHFEYMTPSIDEFDMEQDHVLSEKKKKKERTRRRRRLSDYNTGQIEGLPEQFPDGIVKYWCQRYSLFSRFDDGIKMDEEGWFSVTPEPIARHHAARCHGGIVIDSFTGVGGNAIQFAKRGSHVIAVDIDPQKIEYAQHNAAIYGVNGNINFIVGDFFQLAAKMKADTIFLSPPWGGPDYANVQTYNIKSMLQPRDGYFLFNTSRRIASRVVLFLPRNVDINQLAELSLSADPPWTLEVERNFLNGKLKAVTAYFTDTSV